MARTKAVQTAETENTQAITPAVEENVQTPETPVMPAADPEDSPILKLVYIGPQLPGALLRPNMIIEGKEEEIRTAFAETLKLHPQVWRLMVPAEGLSEAKDKVQKAGTLLNKTYSDLAGAKTKEE